MLNASRQTALIEAIYSLRQCLCFRLVVFFLGAFISWFSLSHSIPLPLSPLLNKNLPVLVCNYMEEKDGINVIQSIFIVVAAMCVYNVTHPHK